MELCTCMNSSAGFDAVREPVSQIVWQSRETRSLTCWSAMNEQQVFVVGNAGPGES